MSLQYPNDEDFYLANRKGFFPYEWFDDFDKLSFKGIPPKEAFSSSVKLEVISEKNYKIPLEVWKQRKMKTFRNYHDYYLANDVLQVADVFRDRIDFCKDNYGLNPLNYVTFLALAKAACMKVTGVSLYPVIDLDLQTAIQQLVRGGISMAVKRVSKANNKYMKNYDPSKPNIFLLYFDANNLYGGDAMSQKLPTGNYRRIREHMIETAVEDKLWRHMPGFSKVDIIIPEHLHDYFNDLPPCPDRRRIIRVHKLVTTPDNKYGYWDHHEAITLWEDMGCII